MKRPLLSFALLVVVAISLAATATADEPAPPKVTTVASGLDHPLGPAIQPGTGAVFVIEGGAGRIVQLGSEGAVEIIGSLPTGSVTHPGVSFAFGPYAIEFVNRNLLAVAVTGKSDDKAPVRFFELPLPAAKVATDKPKYVAGLVAGDDKKATAAGDILGLSVAGDGKVFLISGDARRADRNWLGRVEIADEKAGPITPILSTGADQALALTLSPRGECVTAEMVAGPAGDSVVKFYDPNTKKQLLRLETGLKFVNALAYSPRTGWLYAAGASKEAEGGGLFRLDRAVVDGKPGVKAVLVAALDRPSGMRFAPNGSLYVTLLDKGDADAKEKTGSVVRLTGRL